MFNSLTGTITGKYPQKVNIDTHGIEWEVIVPDTALDKLPPAGETGKVYVWLQHTDQLMTLYGFATEEDRTLFFDLLKVDGIGPKGAVKILGNIDASSLAKILDSGDVDTLQKVPGVGKKTAAKMLLQLKGKLTFVDNDSTVSVKAAKVPYSAVVEALVSMGHDRKRCEQVVSEIAAKAKNDESFESLSAEQKEDSIFRSAIVELAT